MVHNVAEPDADQIDAAADRAISARAVKALIVANRFLETDLDKLKATVAMGYARGRLFDEAKNLPQDLKDWCD
jgi:hypothetical protein